MLEIFKISEHVCQEQQPETKVVTERTDVVILHNTDIFTTLLHSTLRLKYFSIRSFLHVSPIIFS